MLDQYLVAWESPNLALVHGLLHLSVCWPHYSSTETALLALLAMLSALSIKLDQTKDNCHFLLHFFGRIYS